MIIENARVVTSYDEEIGCQWTSDWNPISKNQSHVFNGYVGELLHFMQAARGEAEPLPSIQQEARTMRWLSDMAQSAGIPIEWAPVSSAL